MVVLTDLKSEFFDQIIGKRILIIAAYNVDSVCSFKIVRDILKRHNILFSYTIVKSKIEIKESFDNHGEIENILLVNCGALIDVVEYLEMSEDDKRIIYILDSQRPIHINNYYNQSQVKLLSYREQFDNVPDFDDIYMEEEEESSYESDYNDDESSENYERNTKRKRFDKEAIQKKLDRRKWREKREDLLIEYEQWVFHGTPSSLVAYYLSYLLKQDSSELIWSGVIGNVSQYLFGYMSREQYDDNALHVCDFLTHLNVEKTDKIKKNMDEISVEFLDEMVLFLYRHWTLREALSNTPIILKMFNLLNERGKQRLNSFLAYLGIPHTACDEMFFYMANELRENVVPLMREHCEKFHLSRSEMFIPCFQAKFGYLTPISAVDSAFVILAILEQIKVDRDIDDNFNSALNFISMSSKETIDNGIKLAKKLVKDLRTIAVDMVDSNLIRSYSAFLHVSITKNYDGNMCSALKQNVIARYILELFNVKHPKMGVLRRTEIMPFILCSELDNNKVSLYGIPPLKSNRCKNLFSTLFNTALATSTSDEAQNSLDECRIEITEREKRRIYEKISLILTNKTDSDYM